MHARDSRQLHTERIYKERVTIIKNMDEPVIDDKEQVLDAYCERLQGLRHRALDKDDEAFVRKLAYEALVIEHYDAHMDATLVEGLLDDYVVFWKRLKVFFGRHPHVFSDQPLTYLPTPYRLILDYNPHCADKDSQCVTSAYDHLVGRSVFAGIVPIRTRALPGLFATVLCMIECQIVGALTGTPLGYLRRFMHAIPRTASYDDPFVRIVVTPTYARKRRLLCLFESSTLFNCVMDNDPGGGTSTWISATRVAPCCAPFVRLTSDDPFPQHQWMNDPAIDRVGLWVERALRHDLLPLMSLLIQRGATGLVGLTYRGPHYHDLPPVLLEGVLASHSYIYHESLSFDDSDGFRLLTLKVDNFCRLLAGARTLMTAVQSWIRPVTLQQRAATVAAIERNRQRNDRGIDSGESNDQCHESDPVHARHIECMIETCALWHALCSDTPGVWDQWERLAYLLDMDNVYRMDVAVAMAREWIHNTASF